MRKAWLRVKSLWRRRDLDRDLEDELRFHLEMSGSEQGLSQQEARRRFGNVAGIKEICRDLWTWGSIEIWWSDIRYAFRGMRRNPGFTVVALITLALGIAANTAIFSVVHSVLLRDLPYRDSDQLAILWKTRARFGMPEHNVSIPEFVDWRSQSKAFESMATYSSTHGTLTDRRPGAAEPEVVWFTWVSDDFFKLAGTSPAIGRTFTPEEVAGGNRLAVLSHALWVRRFGASPQVLGQIVELETGAFEVIGVMPREFTLPAADISLWTPAPAHPSWTGARSGRGNYWGPVIGRLRSGVTFERAQAEMNAIAKSMAEQYPEVNAGDGISVIPLHVQVLGKTVPTMLLTLLGAVVFVLLIACANVANLLLARGTVRQREVAVRTALGAGRSRLVRQMLTESMVLSIVAGCFAIPLAALGVDAMIALGPENIPRLGAAGIDGRVLAFTILISVSAGLGFGLAPALKVSRSHANESLAVSGRVSTGTGRARTTRGALVVAEVGLAILLLTGAGLLIRSLRAVLAVDPGFRASQVLSLRLNLRNQVFVQRAMAAIRDLPGVEAVGAINGVMFTGGKPLGNDPVVWTRTGGDVFRALGIGLVRGRFFGEDDTQPNSRPVALVNEAMARRNWPGEDPIGKTVRARNEAFTVVGIVKDMRNQGREKNAVPQVFPAPKGDGIPPFLVVRASSNPLPLIAAIRKTIHNIDKRSALWEISTLQQQLDRQTEQRRFVTLLLGMFAGVALLLAAVGIYGVLHYSVAQRTQEIGIRMALGARAGNVVEMVLREGMTLALAGVALGIAGAYGLTRLIGSMLFGVTPTDPITFASVAGVLIGIALLACYIPARRATKVDPLIALKCE